MSGRQHHHDHSHGASGGHDHHHHHAPPANMNMAFALGVGLNVAFVLAEAGAGIWADSLALLADAGHNLSDVLGLLLAWGAASLARRAPGGRRTYGMRKATILASVTNAVLLLLAVGAIAWEAAHRFAAPARIDTTVVMATAAIGVVINTATALLFVRGSKDDLNVRGAFLHMAADAAVSVGVVIGAGVIALTGFLWIDPALSLAIVAVIVVGTWSLLRDSVDLAMDAAPRDVDVEQVRQWLAAQPGVTEVHDLHIWAMSTTETALTAHLVRPDNADGDPFLHRVCDELEHRFRIGHSTLQVEAGSARACRLAPDEVV